jgi:general stress protein YciG
MAWARIDDNYPSHPKVVAIGAEGLALDVAGICYAARFETDGQVPAMMLGALCPPVADPEAVVQLLVGAGRWHAPGHACPQCPAVTDGWIIHDFLDYNPSAADQADRRRKRAEAGRKGGQRSGQVRSNGSSDGQANASAVASSQCEPPSPAPGGSNDPPRSDSAEPEGESGPDVSATACELTRRFAAGVKVNGHKLPTEGTKAHRRWLVEMDRLLRIDGWDADEVRAVIDWCVTDHGDGTYPGEAANVQSVPKFRQRYSQLRLKVQAAQRANGSAPAYDPVNRDGPDGRPKAVM